MIGSGYLSILIRRREFGHDERHLQNNPVPIVFPRIVQACGEPRRFVAVRLQIGSVCQIGSVTIEASSLARFLKIETYVRPGKPIYCSRTNRTPAYAFEGNFHLSEAFSIEDYLAEHPEPGDGLFEAMLKVEVALRRLRGANFEEQEYPNLIPERESIVGAAIDGTVTCKRPIRDCADPTVDFSLDERASSLQTAALSPAP